MEEKFNVHKYDMPIRKLIEHGEDTLLYYIPDSFHLGDTVTAQDWDYIVECDSSILPRLNIAIKLYTGKSDFLKWLGQYKEWKMKQNLEWIEKQKKN